MTTSRRLRAHAGGKRVSASTSAAPDFLYVAIIGDIVRSRRLPSATRRHVQRRLDEILQAMNTRYRKALASKFLITVGDEFQGLLRDPSVVPELIRRLENGLPDIDVRLGIGRGRLDTDLKAFAIGMDGEVWHAARAAIEDARANRRLGGVFLGFGERTDTALNGFARVLHHIRSRLTTKQRELLEALLEAGTQTEVAVRVGITRQAVSKQMRAAGGDAYREAEAAWKVVLTDASTGDSHAA
jgi:hypothetical protein